MKKNIGLGCGAILVVLMSVQTVFAQGNTFLEMGVNVNERPHWLETEMLEQSQTTWVRAFVEASHYIEGDRSLEDDFRIEALKEKADNGYKVLLSIKWDLKEADWRVPEPGSREEEKWFEFTRDLLEELDAKLSILVLVNEVTIDIPEKDLLPNDNGVIPFMRFQKRLLDYVAELKPKAADGNSLPIYTGGLTRLDQQKQQNHPVNKAMITWVNEEERLAGLDFHMHQHDYKTSLEAARFIREQIPEKSLIVTEFSFVWKWKEYLGDEIGSSESGKQFAEEYNLDPELTVAEYSSRAFKNPVPEKEWMAFLKSQPWYEPYYLDIMGRMMENIDVDVATYAFTQNPETDDSWNITERTNPWFMHQIFMPRVAYSDSDRTAVNYGMFESFVRWQKNTKKLKAAELK